MGVPHHFGGAVLVEIDCRLVRDRLLRQTTRHTAIFTDASSGPPRTLNAIPPLSWVCPPRRRSTSGHQWRRLRRPSARVTEARTQAFLTKPTEVS